MRGRGGWSFGSGAAKGNWRDTTAVQCMTGCGNTHPHKKGLSLKQQDREANRRAAPCLHVHTGRARAPTDSRQAHKQSCIVHCAQPRESRAGIQDDSCADASGAKEQRQEAGDRHCRSKNFVERARRGRCRCEERKAACTRHSEVARARPRPHARLGCGARRRGGKGWSAEQRGLSQCWAGTHAPVPPVRETSD